jgi:hypothetical protein
MTSNPSSNGYDSEQVKLVFAQDTKKELGGQDEEDIQARMLSGAEFHMVLTRENALTPASSDTYAFIIEKRSYRMGRVDPESGQVGDIRTGEIMPALLVLQLTELALAWHTESFGPGFGNPQARAQWEGKHLSEITQPAIRMHKPGGRL